MGRSCARNIFACVLIGIKLSLAESSMSGLKCAKLAVRVTDIESSGRPATATTMRYEERSLELIRENRRVTVDEVAGKQI